MVILIMKVMVMMVFLIMIMVMMMMIRMSRRVNIRNQLGHVAFLLQTLKTVQKEKFIAEMK